MAEETTLIPGVPDDFTNDFILNSGGTKDITKLILSGVPYGKFKSECLKLIKREFINNEDDSEQFSLDDKLFDNIKDFDIDEAQYEELVKKSRDMIYEIQALYRNSQKTKYRFPIETILNGNYEGMCLDKTKLTEEFKVQFNVQGLPDDLYDIIYYEPNDELITVYYDKSTKNEQWYIFTTYLEEYFKFMGIKGNHLTPLLLFDRDLMGIDTDKVTNPEIMCKIKREGQRNPYYHFREIARNAPNEEGVKTRYFINIATWTFFWLYSQNKNTFREQSRQTGKTYDMGHMGGYEFGYGSERCSIGAFHFIYTKAAENRKTWVGYANLYPEYLQIHNIISKTTRGKTEEIKSPEPMSPSNAKVVENKKNSTKFIAIAIGTSKQAAEQAGRGSTLRFILGDELNFIKYIKVAFTALMYAHGTARKLAESNGLRTGMHFASTAGTLDTEQGRMMHRFIFEEMVRFDPVLFTLNYKDLTAFINTNSKNRFVLISYSYKDIGFSEEWLDESIAGKSVEDNRTEILNHWLSSTSGGLFKTDALGRLDVIVKKHPTKTYLFNKLNIFRYSSDFESFESLIKNVGVLSIGMDFALGDLGDYTSFTGVDLLTGKRLFDFDDNNMDSVDCCIFIKAFVRHILSIKPNIKMVLVPEIDGPGKSSIIPNLKRDPVVEPYLFRTIQISNKEITEPQIKSTSYSINEKSYIEYGTYMRRVRKVLFDSLLFELVDKYPYAFADQKASNEVKTLIKTKAGKILAKSGFHDDKICSTLHAYSPLFLDDYRECLAKLFNIHVSVSNLEADPLTSTVFNLKEEEEVLEGRVSWKISKHVDEYGQEYETIRVFKILNASLYELNEREIQSERLSNDALNDAINNLKRRMIPIGNRSSIKEQNSPNNLMNSSYNSYNKNLNNSLLRMNSRQQQMLLRSGKISKKNMSLI